MIREPTNHDVVAEILQEILDVLDRGNTPTFETLLERFPGREPEIRDALRALHAYQAEIQNVRKVRHQAVQAGGILPAGTRLGDFTIEGFLGQGAMGVVYRARQASLGDRAVALKVLPPELVSRDPRFAERFRREASLAADVHHPNVASVYGSGQERDLLFFAMQLVEGQTLETVLNGLALQRRLGDTRNLHTDHVRRAVQVVRDVANALSAIHARNLVHRDVKPANILLEHASDEDQEALAGRPVLVDFGLLRPVGSSDLTGSRTLLGTPAFAAPECQVGRAADPRADVFSLGAILHDLLTLTPARERGVASAGMTQLRALNPTVDSRLLAIVEMALQDRPALRFADGSAFREDLDRYLENRPVLARPTTPLGRARLWARRNPLRSVKIAAGGIVILAVLLSLFWLGSHVIQLYAAASSGSRLEQEGDLLGAADAYKPLTEHQAWTRGLPGLGDDAHRAIDYWNRNHGRLDLVRRQLALESEPGLHAAHDRIHGLLLTPGNEDIREPLLRFLVREIAHGETPLQKQHAVETVTHYLLIHPTVPEPDTWASDLVPSLLRIVSDPKTKNPATRLLALSALSGMQDIDVFENLLARFTDPDPEIRRLAVQATRRIWWLIQKNQQALADNQEHWARWVKNAWVAMEQYGKHEPPISPGLRNALLSSMHDVAWIRRCLRANGQLQAWPGLTDEQLRVLAAGEARFSGDDKEVNEDPVRSGAGNAEIPSWWSFSRHDASAHQLEMATRGNFTNVWQQHPDAQDEESAENPAVDTHGREGRFDFEHVKESASGILTPTLSGTARLARWTDANMETEFDARRGQSGVPHFLVFTRPAVSRCTLRSVVPEKAARAYVSLVHCRAARWVLPRVGHARIRITVGDSDMAIERDVLTHNEDRLSFEVDPNLLRSHETLDLDLTLVSASTTYRLMHVQIRFETDEAGEPAPR